MRLNKSNSRIPKMQEPSKDWGLICGIVLAMLGLVGMLVFLTQKQERGNGEYHRR